MELKRSLLLIFFFTAASPSLAATFLIAPGTSSFDCQYQEVAAGDVIIIAGGERGPLQIRNCTGRSGNHIIIRNDPSSTSPVIIRRVNGSSSGFLFTISNSRYITVDGTGGWVGMPAGAYCGAPAGRNGCGIVMKTIVAGDQPTAYYKIHGLNMRDQIHRGFLVDGTVSYGSGTQIGVDFNDHSINSSTNPGVWRENVTFERFYITHTFGEGMYVGPNTSSDPANSYYDRVPLRSITIQDGLLENIGREPINIKAVFGDSNHYSNIRRNYIYNSGLRNDGSHVDAIASQGAQLNVYNNYIENVAGSGVTFATSLGITPTEYLSLCPMVPRVWNNVIINTGLLNSTRQHGIAVIASSDCQQSGVFYNNTIKNARGACVNMNSSSLNTITRNNILVDCAGGAIKNNGTGSVSENNIIGSSAAVQFVNNAANNLRLQESSPARNPNPSIRNFPAEDFDGSKRPEGEGADIGAFEYVFRVPRSPTIM
jgi:hypothetical protein